MSRRYPLEALVVASGLSEHQLSVKVGLKGTTLRNARTDGLIERAADRYAVRAGLHPFEVWPEMAEHQLEDTSTECAAPDCARRFIPTRSGHRFCSRRCGDRTTARIRYRADSELAERKRAARRRYYAEAGDYERARQRRYDRAQRERAA